MNSINVDVVHSQSSYYYKNSVRRRIIRKFELMASANRHIWTEINIYFKEIKDEKSSFREKLVVHLQTPVFTRFFICNVTFFIVFWQQSNSLKNPVTLNVLNVEHYYLQQVYLFLTYDIQRDWVLTFCKRWNGIVFKLMK